MKINYINNFNDNDDNIKNNNCKINNNVCKNNSNNKNICKCLRERQRKWQGYLVIIEAICIAKC